MMINVYKHVVAIVTKTHALLEMSTVYSWSDLYGQCVYSSLLFHLLLQCVHYQSVTLQYRER